MNADRAPFFLRPFPKDYLWGGTRLNDDFRLGLNVDPLAEAWVCSSHPDGESVSDGGEPLGELLNVHPEWLGSHPLSVMEGRGGLPVLIKLIDADKDLSVQVHPDDAYAFEREGGQLGKTEMWYVIDAKPGARLVYGFREDLTSAQVRAAVENGTICKFLNSVDVRPDDVFFIEPGTVHAIGRGCLIAEVQESSNLTYRLYDYGRIDKHGRARALHLEKALDVAHLKGSAAPRQPMRVLRYSGGMAAELLTRCKYFQVERILLNSEARALPVFNAGGNSFHALLCIQGCGVIFGYGCALNFFKGDCVFVPAGCMGLRLHGRAEFLDVSC